MKSIHIGLSGAQGRMGKAICELISSDSQFKLKAQYDTQNSLDSWKSSDIDVVIDFSLPKPFTQVLNWCLKNKKPFVSGTTGLSSQDKSLLQESSSKIPVLWAPNMSLGVAYLNECLQKLPKEIKNWNFQIEETHHTLKKDTPSGTALFLNQTLEKQGIQTQDIISKREENVFGIHQVIFSNNEEIVSLKHKALNRRIFARGALWASIWILQRSPGFYQIQDCLQ